MLFERILCLFKGHDYRAWETVELPVDGRIGIPAECDRCDSKIIVKFYHDPLREVFKQATDQLDRRILESNAGEVRSIFREAVSKGPSGPTGHKCEIGVLSPAKLRAAKRRRDKKTGQFLPQKRNSKA